MSEKQGIAEQWWVGEPNESYDPKLWRLMFGKAVVAYVLSQSNAVMLKVLIQGITPQEYEQHYVKLVKYSGG